MCWRGRNRFQLIHRTLGQDYVKACSRIHRLAKTQIGKLMYAVSVVLICCCCDYNLRVSDFNSVSRIYSNIFMSFLSAYPRQGRSQRIWSRDNFWNHLIPTLQKLSKFLIIICSWNNQYSFSQNVEIKLKIGFHTDAGLFLPVVPKLFLAHAPISSHVRSHSPLTRLSDFKDALQIILDVMQWNSVLFVNMPGRPSLLCDVRDFASLHRFSARTDSDWKCIS